MRHSSDQKRMVYGVSTSVLFDMTEPDEIFRTAGPEAYAKFMRERSDEPLPLGKGFKNLRRSFEADDFLEVVLCSRNSPLTARRAILTLLDQGITPGRSFFTSGKSPVPFLDAYGIRHFRTANYEDAVAAAKMGVFSTYHDLRGNRTVNNPEKRGAPKTKSNVLVLPGVQKAPEDSLRLVYSETVIGHHIFDLDGVVFGTESEDFFRRHGLKAYMNYEGALRDKPMSKGPAFEILKYYNDVNARFAGSKKPFELSLVTARGYEATLRAMETLHTWGIDFSGSAHFLAGQDKGPVLAVMSELAQDTSIEFYDDQTRNVEKGSQADILSGEVPTLLGEGENDPDGPKVA